MEPITPSSLILAVFLWIGYFLVVAFSCHTLYAKLRGSPPKSPNLTVMVNGKSVSALAEWEARDKRLQRAMIAVAILLVLLPLLLPWLLRAHR